MKVLKLEMKKTSEHNFWDPRNGATLCCYDLCRFWGVPKNVKEVDILISDVPKRGFAPVVLGVKSNWLKNLFMVCFIAQKDECLADPDKVDPRWCVSFTNVMKTVFENHFGMIGIGNKKVFYVKIMV